MDFRYIRTQTVFTFTLKAVCSAGVNLRSQQKPACLHHQELMSRSSDSSIAPHRPGLELVKPHYRVIRAQSASRELQISEIPIRRDKTQRRNRQPDVVLCSR